MQLRDETLFGRLSYRCCTAEYHRSSPRIGPWSPLASDRSADGSPARIHTWLVHKKTPQKTKTHTHYQCSRKRELYISSCRAHKSNANLISNFSSTSKQSADLRIETPVTYSIHKEQMTDRTARITSSHCLSAHVSTNKLSDLFSNKDHRQEREELRGHTDTHFLIVLWIWPKARADSLVHSASSLRLTLFSKHVM